MKNEDQHSGKSGVLTTPSSTVSEKKSARCRVSAKVIQSDSPPVCFHSCPWCPRNYLRRLLLRLDHHLLNLLQCSPHALFSLPDDNIWIGDKVETGDRTTPSSVASSRSPLATLPPKGDVITTSSSVELNFLNIQWRG